MNSDLLPWRSLTVSLACTVSVLAGEPVPVRSQPTAEIELTELGKFDLETLLNMEVTSVSKKEARFSQSAAAIYVITQDDIRRSGMTTLPELFRMVPGMDVARVNGNQWAVSSRGFNDPYANKLLVLVDGRSVYTPSFGGVFWADQDLVLADLDRIEVIRGPGATLWGANAVNGVINVITKKAKDTEGLLLSSTYGTLDQPSTSLRYGGKLADGLYYRIYGKYFNHESFETPAHRDAGDDWQMGSGGLRLDWEPDEASFFTLDSSYYNGSIGENYNVPILVSPYARAESADNHDTGGHVLGRWTHHISEDSQLNLQAYYDSISHREFGAFIRQDTFDLELQHRFKPIEPNEVVWGFGYRYLPDELGPSATLNWADPETHHQLFNFFAQDEITLVEDRLKLTLGSKFEHNDYTGLELQPGARLLFTPGERQSIWASVSRAVRTPARSDRNLQGNLWTLPAAGGNPPISLQSYGSDDFKSEEVIAYELGYRVQPFERVTFDIAGFYNVLDDLRRYQTGTPVFEAAPVPHLVIPSYASNVDSGSSFGTEISAQWTPLDHLRFDLGYSWIQFDLDPDNAAGLSTPEQQIHLRSYLDLPHSIQLMGAASYVDRIWANNGLTSVPIPSYVRLDFGITWRPMKNLELGIWGQNLLDPAHAEFTSYRTTDIAEVPRSVLGKVTWRF